MTDLTPGTKPDFLSGKAWVETASALSRECSAVGLAQCLRSKHFAPELTRLAQRRVKDCYQKGMAR